MKLFVVSLQRDSAFAFILKVLLSSSPKYNSRADLVLYVKTWTRTQNLHQGENRSLHLIKTTEQNMTAVAGCSRGSFSFHWRGS